MLNDSLKLMIEFPPPKWVGYFTTFLQKFGSIASKKTIFIQIVKKLKFFQLYLNWALKDVHAIVSKVFPKKLLDFSRS